jgi:hypothetical protein
MTGGLWRLGGHVVLVCSVTVAVSAVSGLTRELAALCAEKVETITQVTHDGPEPRRTVLSESEVNSWLRFVAVDKVPAGLTELAVSFVGDGRVSGRAVVDLDVLGRRKIGGGLLDPWRYLTGRVPVMAHGTLLTGQGVGRFVMESASIGGVSVPKVVIQDLVGFYLRSPSRPHGVSMDDPFALPAGIDELEVGPGEAVVIQ